MAVKGPFGGVGAPLPNFDLSSNSCNNIFSLTAQKLHFLYSAKLVGYDYVWFFVKKSPHTFLEGKRPLVFGDGAPNIYPTQCTSKNYFKLASTIVSVIYHWKALFALIPMV